MKKARRYAEGDVVDVDEGAISGPAPKEAVAEEATEKPETFKEAFTKARRAGDKTFDWNGKTYSTKVAGESKAKTEPAKAEERKSDTATKPATRTTSFPSGSLAGRIARSQGAVSTVPEPTSSAGEKSARQRQETMDMFSRMGKKLQRYMGTQETRDRLKAEGYAKGGMTASKRADGIAQRGKTRGKVY